jgi:hypothetical protein
MSKWSPANVTSKGCKMIKQQLPMMTYTCGFKKFSYQIDTRSFLAVITESKAILRKYWPTSDRLIVNRKIST